MYKLVGKWWKLLLFAVLAAAFLARPPVVLAEIHINFENEDYAYKDEWKAIASMREYAGLNSVKDTYETEKAAVVFFWDALYTSGGTLKRMDPIDFTYEEVIKVESLELYINGFYAGILEREQLLSAFEPNDQAAIGLDDAGMLEIEVSGADSQLIMTDAFRAFYSKAASTYARTGILYLAPAVLALYGVYIFYKKKILRSGRTDTFMVVADTLLYAVGVAALVLIITGAFTGSAEVNPDESDSIYSVQYYITHWKVPHAEELDAEAYSLFGTARLNELTYYYFLAAQVARFFTFEHSARFLGVLMAVGLFYFVFANLEKNRFLVCTLFLTPQVWYIFTYCTSDSLDYAVGVLVLYQMANPESMLNTLLEEGVHKINALKLVPLGLLIANIFLSKQNFYVFAIYVFCMLLADICFMPAGRKKGRFITCIQLAVASLAALCVCCIPQFINYGFSRWRVILEVREKRAIAGLNPASPPEVQSSAFNLYGKGVTLNEILSEMGLNKTLFKSFAGTYGCLQFPSPDWYYTVMALLYLGLLIMTVYAVMKIKCRAASGIKLLLLFFCAFVSYALVIFNAWFVDFQAQGRYMLPVLVFISHAVSLEPSLANKKASMC